MKKSYLFSTALALTLLASCSSDEFVGENNPQTSNETNGAISFTTGSKAMTRADATGVDAATALNNHFYVYGIKKESVDGAGNVQAGNLVFNNYAVNWTANSAMTTTSNTENWEYVGYTLTEKEQAKITANSGAVAQTIKYWDWGAADYTFYAFSAKPEDISGDKITVAKVQNQKTTDEPAHTVFDNGYTVTLAAGASLDDLYFSERVNIVQSEGSNATNTDRQADNTYGGNVTFRFHRIASKVRVAMYETIPGYSVTINSFKVVDNASPTFETMTTSETGSFKANFVNNANGTAGSMTVKYVESGATRNHPTVSFTPTSSAANILALGDQLKANVIIGESATGATYDQTGKAYTSVFPKEDNTQNLKLKVCYTLTAPVTGEKITVTDATAEIPANYLKWKPGYAYTYIFKISDNTNGQTGTGTTPVGLYPITFDAVETVDEDGLAEYITTVSEPSITTFGVNSSTGKYVTGGNEYAAGSDIYATIMDGSSVKDFTLGTDVNVYHVTTADASNFKITEASVAEALAANKSNAMNVDIYTFDGASTYTKVDDASTLAVGTTYYKADANSVAPGETGYVQTAAVADVDYVIVKIKATNINAETTPYFTTAPNEVTTVPGENGVDITGTNALKLTGVAATTTTTAYAIEYIKSEVFTTDGGKTYATAEAFTAAGTLYKETACTNVADATYYAANPGATYYKKIVNMPGTKVYKVIVVQ